MRLVPNTTFYKSSKKRLHLLIIKLSLPESVASNQFDILFMFSFPQWKCFYSLHECTLILFFLSLDYPPFEIFLNCLQYVPI